MMSAQLITFVLHRLADHLRLNPIASIIVSTVLAVCFFLLGTGIVLAVHAWQLVPTWIMDPVVVVYLRSDISPREVEESAERFRKMPEIESIQITTKQEAWNRLSKQLGDWRPALDGLNEDFLPPSLEMKLRNRALKQEEEFDRVIERIKQDSRVEDVFSGRGSYQWVLSLAAGFKSAGVWGAALLCMASVVMVTGKMKLTAAERREELAMYRLAGASEAFIRMPFYLEGILYGMIGSTFAFFGILIAMSALRSALPFPPGALFSWDTREIVALCLGVFSLGIFFCHLGCWLGLRDFHEA